MSNKMYLRGDERSYIVKMLTLGFYLFCNHLLLLGVMDRTGEICPCDLNVAYASYSQCFQEREYSCAILDALGRVDQSNVAPFGLIGVEETIACPTLLRSSNFVSEVVNIGEP